MQSPLNQNAQIIGLQKNGATLWAFLGELQSFIKSPENVEKNLGRFENELAKLNTDLDKIGNADVTAFNDFMNNKITGPDQLAMGKAMAIQIDAIRDIQNLLITAHATIDYKNLPMEKFVKYESLVHSKLEALMSLILTPDIDKYLLTANKLAIQEKTQERDKVDLEIGSLTTKSGKKDKGAKEQLKAKIEEGQALDASLSKLQEEKVTLLIQQLKNSKEKDLTPLIEERSRLETQQAKLETTAGDGKELGKIQAQLEKLIEIIDQSKIEKQSRRISAKIDQTIEPESLARRSTISKQH